MVLFVMTDALESVPIGQDATHPFILENWHIRGRLVRLDKISDTIIGFHDYPPALAKLLSETLSITAALGALIKFEGSLNLQISGGKGRLQMLLCDVTHEGALRGLVSCNIEDRPFWHALDLAQHIPFYEVLRGGYLALTLDRTGEQERTQGLVAADRATVADMVMHYFEQSEQLPTYLKVTSGKGSDGSIQASCLIIQEMPKIAPRSEITLSGLDIDGFGTARALLASVKDEELLDLPPEKLLWRLFHEGGVRVFPERGLSLGCRCDTARLKSILGALNPEERSDCIENGKITMTCQFCNKNFVFEPW
jgi:molecular chaperone Hsp33